MLFECLLFRISGVDGDLPAVFFGQVGQGQLRRVPVGVDRHIDQVFLFFFLAELIAEWLPRWAAFLIVFVLMLVIAGVAAFLGLQKVKKVGKPEKTIQSVQELKTVIPSSGNASRNPSHATADGLYT